MRNDFIFDGRLASEFGLIITDIGKTKQSTETNDVSVTNFIQFKPANKDKYYFTACEYPNVLSKTIQVIRLVDCEYQPLSSIDIEEITRWLCRDDGYHPFSFINDDDETYEYNAKIDLKTVEIMNEYVGLELTITTDSPYAYTTVKKTHIFNGTDSYEIADNSTKIGTINVNAIIKLISGGDFEMNCEFHGQKKALKIGNCKANEIIKITDLLEISSNLDTHKISKDFNFVFPTISNTIENGKNLRENIFTPNLPCEIEFKYKYIRKVGI